MSRVFQSEDPAVSQEMTEPTCSCTISRIDVYGDTSTTPETSPVCVCVCVCVCVSARAYACTAHMCVLVCVCVSVCLCVYGENP